MSDVIIIPVHNQLQYVVKCVVSVIMYTKDFEIIIVDDGSTDKECVKWIKKQGKLKHITVLRNETAKGFSNACNIAIDYAMEHFDFVCLCLLNSDTEIYTDSWFEKVSMHYDVQNIGIAGVMSNNALSQSVRNIPEYLGKIENMPTVYSHLVHGFCYFMSRKLIETIGKLDEETFPHYGSEDDYSLKAMKHGFQNIIVGSVFVYHKAETSYGEEIRKKYIKTSLPALLRRWGKSYVDNCIRQSIKIGAYLNDRQ